MRIEEAMARVAEGIFVRRSSWPQERFLHSEECDVSETDPEGWFIADHWAHPAGGSTFGNFVPTPEDESAEDWESHYH
jgi:hypothetical protein